MRHVAYGNGQIDLLNGDIMKKHVLAIGLLSALAVQANAGGLYISGDVGQSKFSGDLSDSDTAFAVGLGYNLNKNFSLELSHHDLGGVEKHERTFVGLTAIDVNASADASATALSLIAKAPLSDSFDLYGRLGYAKITVDATATGSGGGFSASESISASENKAIFGAGAAYNINEKFALRAEYIKFGDTDISSFTIGASFTF